MRSPIFFDAESGALFIRATASGIPALRLLVDAPQFTYFNGDTTRPYLPLDWAIEWHEKELAWLTRARVAERWPGEALERLKTMKAHHDNSKGA